MKENVTKIILAGKMTFTSFQQTGFICSRSIVNVNSKLMTSKKNGFDEKDLSKDVEKKKI